MSRISGSSYDSRLMSRSGDGSTLSLDFTAMGGVLDPRLTFDRTSTATFVNSSGLVQFANANLMTFSTPRSAGSSWLTSGTVTWGSATITDPLGNATAQEVTLGTVASAIFNTTGTTVVSGITHTFSVWLRAASGTTNVRIGDANVAPVSTVTLTTTWQRFNCQYVTNGTNDGGAIFSQTGTPSSTFYVWGAQVQPGSIVGDLLETTGSIRRNTPRFDYSPTNIGEPRGLLVEGQTANACPQSQALTTGWLNANMITPTNPAIADPFGGTSATWKLVAASGNALHSWRHAVITLTAAAYTFSFWAKAAEYDRVVLSDPGSGLGACTFVLTGNGTATVVGGATNPQITPYPSGWYRCSVTMTSSATTYAFGIAGYPTTGTTLSNFGATYTGTGTDGAYATGLQIELGSGASSYIPTGASGVTRSADHCTMPTASFIPSNPYPQTLFIECIPNTPSGAFLDIARIFDRTAGGAFSYGTEIYYYNASTMTAQRKIGAATNTERNFATGLAYGTRHKFALSIDASSFFGSYDGVTGLGVTTAPAALSTVATHLGIGCSGEASPNVVMFGTIRQIKFYPTALSQSEINTLTTL